jgi:hypothetical protein
MDAPQRIVGEGDVVRAIGDDQPVLDIVDVSVGAVAGEIAVRVVAVMGGPELRARRLAVAVERIYCWVSM